MGDWQQGDGGTGGLFLLFCSFCGLLLLFGSFGGLLLLFGFLGGLFLLFGFLFLSRLDYSRIF